jgi:hypothetical protein
MPASACVQSVQGYLFLEYPHLNSVGYRLPNQPSTSIDTIVNMLCSACELPGLPFASALKVMAQAAN